MLGKNWIVLLISPAWHSAAAELPILYFINIPLHFQSFKFNFFVCAGGGAEWHNEDKNGKTKGGMGPRGETNMAALLYCALASSTLPSPHEPSRISKPPHITPPHLPITPCQYQASAMYHPLVTVLAKIYGCQGEMID